MTFYYPLETQKVSLKAKTLVVPIVSVANVPQLAADLLIASLELLQIGIFDSRDLIPVIGARENGEAGVTTPLELYGKDGIDVVVIQQRSPVLKVRKDSFVESLSKFVQENQMAGLVLLAGMDLVNRTDAQMQSPIYKLVPPHAPALESTCLSIIAKLPTYTFVPSERTVAPRADSASGIPFIPGGGITRRLLAALPADWATPTACILQFVFEGDNRTDAERLASVVARVLGLDEKIRAWKQPGSWNVGLFGTPHDQSLYG